MKKLFYQLCCMFIVFVFFGCNGLITNNNIENVYEVSEHIKVAFTEPGSVVAAQNIRNEIETLIENQSADYYLDVCIYGLDDIEIIRMLKHSIEKGVHVRFIGDKEGSNNLSTKKGDYYDGYTIIADSLDKYFPVQKGKRINVSSKNKFDDFAIINKKGIMHNKFMVFTDENGAKTVMTGSMNYTSSCLTLNNNDVIFIKNNKIAEKYIRQFEYLMEIRENAEKYEEFVLDGTEIGIGFSLPVSGSQYLANVITKEIEHSKESIDFMIFTYTSKIIAEAMCDKSDLDINGIFDGKNLKYAQKNTLSSVGINCKTDGNNYIEDNHGGKLHNKCMIIDKGTEEATVITGSFNWTVNADTQNNENLLVIRSSIIADLYEQYFTKQWKAAF